MEEVSRWLKRKGLCFTGAGKSCLIFDPPPNKEEAHGAVLIPWDTPAAEVVANELRARRWVVCVFRTEQDAIQWLVCLGYGSTGESRPMLRVPTSRAFGSSGVSLAAVAARITSNPAITSRELAAELSRLNKKPIGRNVANRAMIAIGWGPEEREAFRNGTIKAPVVVDSV